MSNLVGMLVASLVKIMLPTVIKEMTKFLEEIVELDIDGDGQIGFRNKKGEVVIKTVREVVDGITGNETETAKGKEINVN